MALKALLKNGKTIALVGQERSKTATSINVLPVEIISPSYRVISKLTRVPGLTSEAKSALPKTPTELTRSLKALLQTNRNKRLFGVLCVRLHAFEAVQKKVGDLGVEALILEAYRRLVTCVRTTDLVAEGESGIFLILAMEFQAEAELGIISGRIQKTCLQPYSVFGQSFTGDLTIGAAATAGEDVPAELAARAVAAMQLATTQQQPYVLSPMKEPVRAMPTLSAIVSRELFQVMYLPQLGKTGVLLAARVVVEVPRIRQHHGVLSGAALKGLAVKQERLSDLVLRHVVCAAQSWQAKGFVTPLLSLECEAGQLLSPSFAGMLVTLLKEQGLPGSVLELLLTEQTIQKYIDSGSRTITILEAAGIQFGLCGFSASLGTRLDLRKLSFASLRVSCKGLFTVTSTEESIWLARSLVAVARRCGLAFVGEDVETTAQRDILLASGCERFEGPLLSPAVSAADFELLLIPK